VDLLTEVVPLSNLSLLAEKSENYCGECWHVLDKVTYQVAYRELGEPNMEAESRLWLPGLQVEKGLEEPQQHLENSYLSPVKMTVQFHKWWRVREAAPGFDERQRDIFLMRFRRLGNYIQDATYVQRGESTIWLYQFSFPFQTDGTKVIAELRKLHLVLSRNVEECLRSH
jgi:hypothetical protein